MPIVNVQWVDNRSVEQKRQLAERLTAALVDVAKCPPEAVTIIFSDYPSHDIAKAGKLLSD